MSARIKLSRENADRLAAGKPIKMLRGRLGWHLPRRPAPPLVDIHPASHLSEDAEGAILVAGAAGQWWGKSLIHIPNEGGSGIAGLIRSRKMKAQGAKAGVADYFIAVPVAPAGAGLSGWPGLWVELKAATGKPNAEQLAFLTTMQDGGYAACIAYGADAARDAIDTYLKGVWPK